METIGVAQPQLGQTGNAPAGAITISVEWVIVTVAAAGLSMAVAAGRWLISREFNRFEQRDKEQEARLKALERSDTDQRMALQVAGGLAGRVDGLERQVQAIALALETLPKIQKQLDGLEDLKVLGDRFQNVVYALNQAQDLTKEFQKDVMALRAELPKSYVPEDKYVRDMTVLTSRVDAVWERIDTVAAGQRLRYLEGQQ